MCVCVCVCVDTHISQDSNTTRYFSSPVTSVIRNSHRNVTQLILQVVSGSSKI